jgi:hypothetical protein
MHIEAATSTPRLKYSRLSEKDDDPLAVRITDMGIVRFGAEISLHLLRSGRLHRLCRRLRHLGHAGGYLPGNQHSGGVGDLAVQRP